MELHKLLRVLQPYMTYKGENPEITAIVNDNRKVTPGSLFVCIEGYTVDGHDFAASAAEKGAAAVISQKELDLAIPVIVVKNTKRAMACWLMLFIDSRASSFI